MHKAAPIPPYHHRQPTSWGEIILRTALANTFLIIVALIAKTNQGFLPLALFILSVYPIVVFLESLWLHGLKQKYAFYILSFVLLFVFAFIQTVKLAGVLPRFTWPEIISQWHFYVYFPAIMPYLSHKLSQLLFRTD